MYTFSIERTCVREMAHPAVFSCSRVGSSVVKQTALLTHHKTWVQNNQLLSISNSILTRLPRKAPGAPLDIPLDPLDLQVNRIKICRLPGRCSVL